VHPIEPSVRRCDRCDARLARYNPGLRCAPCSSRSLRQPPEVPPEFWDAPQMRDALATHHMGRVVYVYRNHPWHGQVLKQSVVAGWFALSQTQLSRIENGRAPEEISKLIRWAELLRIPADRWWFKKVPGETGNLAQPLPGAAGMPFAAAIAARTSAADVRPALQTAANAGSQSAAMVIAGESAEIAASEASRTVAPMSVAQVTEELARLAREYAGVPPLVMLGRARRLRDESHRLSERTRAPAQLADLHLVTGAACGLLARSSWDLGAWSAAIEQAHAAGIYGQLAGHPGLQAWAAGTEALIAFWRSRPRDAVDAAGRGLQLVSSGTPRARLHCIAARAWAHLGATDRVRAELRAADLALGRAGGLNAEVLHDEVAGEYGWSPGRHAMCAATALLVAGDLVGAAARAREATTVPGGDPAVAAKAHADLACVELAGGNLDAAAEALTLVWEVAPDFRSYPLLGRLDSAATALAKPRYSRTRSATDLGERIRAYRAASAPALVSGQVLPPGS
jgi:transcriptional regulator with XRE-family HTH domain